MNLAKIEDGLVANIEMWDEIPPTGGYIDVTGQAVKIGWPVADGQVVPPEPDPPTQEDMRVRLLAFLAEIDAQSIRPARAIAAAQAVGHAPDQADIDRLADLEAQAVAARAELAALHAA